VSILVNLDVMLARRKMRLNTLAEMVGITPQNLSVLKAGRAKAIRFSTLHRICEVLDCQPGDLLMFQPDQELQEGNKQQSEDRNSEPADSLGAASQAAAEPVSNQTSTGK
jgi:putative transcriptional regulator